MYLKEPKDENGRLSVAVELITTIYSGHAAGQERRTSTARLIPLEETEDEDLVPIIDAAKDITLTVNESTPDHLVPLIEMVEQGIRGLVRAFGYDVV